MVKNKKIVSVLTLSVLMFCLSLFHAENSICCMFASNRERGFPYKVLLISKGTDSLQEAQKVYYLNDIELLEQGWELRAGSVFGSAFLNIALNIIFYSAISWGLFLAAGRIRQVYERE